MNVPIVTTPLRLSDELRTLTKLILEEDREAFSEEYGKHRMTGEDELESFRVAIALVFDRLATRREGNSRGS